MRGCRNVFTAVFALVVCGFVPAPAGAAEALRPDTRTEAPTSAPAPKPPSPPTAGVPTAPAPPLPPSAPDAALPAAAAPAAPKPGRLVSPKKPELVGTVIYVNGARVVAEVRGGAKENERFRVFDVASRLRGEAVARKALDEATCLLEPVGAVTIAVGDRLARARE